MSTVQPSFFSSTYFAMYVLAVDPAHACSLSVTFPHEAPRVAAAPLDPTSAVAAATATAAQTQRFDISPPPSTLLVDPAARAPVALRDSVERDAQREDCQGGDDAVAECVSLQALGDLIAERPRAHEPADHDHREHHDDPLVDAEHDRLARQRDLDLDEDLRPSRAERARRLDGVRRDV